jgi:hypothetical protein
MTCGSLDAVNLRRLALLGLAWNNERNINDVA